MPTYEYRCKTCDHEFEIVQAFTDASLTECPECGGVLKKVFGNVGITFKGSGFYKTDSRSAGSFGSARDADRSDTGSSSKPSGTDAKGSDAKPSDAKGGSKGSGDGGSSGSSSSSSSSTAATPAS
jgi:putative FmdB family regulatory protein